MPRHPPYALSSLIQRAFKRDTALLLPYELSKNVSGFLMPEKFRLLIGGDNRARTGNLRRARAALSQLSYIPKSLDDLSTNLVGLDRVELSTSRLSGVRSNQLSYRPQISN